MVDKSTEQLAEETTTLFRKIDKQNQSISDLTIQLVQLKGNVDTLIKLMEQSLSKGITAAECTSRHQNVVEKITRVEEEMCRARNIYVTKVELVQLTEDLKGLKGFLIKMVLVFLVPLGAIAIHTIYGGAL